MSSSKFNKTDVSFAKAVVLKEYFGIPKRKDSSNIEVTSKKVKTKRSITTDDEGFSKIVYVSVKKPIIRGKTPKRFT